MRELIENIVVARGFFDWERSTTGGWMHGPMRGISTRSKELADNDGMKFETLCSDACRCFRFEGATSQGSPAAPAQPE